MKKLLNLFSLTALLLAFTANAHALLSLSLTDTGTGDLITITDNGLGDLSSTLGRMATWGDIGDWSYFTGVAGTPYVGSEYLDEFNLSSMNVKHGGSGTGTLVIELLATDIMRDGALYNIGIGGTAAGSIVFETYINGTLVSDSGALNSAFSFADSGSVAQGLAPYDLRMVATITSGMNTESSFNYKVTIPEPGILSLLGLGLFALGLFTRKQKAA